MQQLCSLQNIVRISLWKCSFTWIQRLIHQLIAEVSKLGSQTDFFVCRKTRRCHFILEKTSLVACKGANLFQNFALCLQVPKRTCTGLLILLLITIVSISFWTLFCTWWHPPCSAQTFIKINVVCCQQGFLTCWNWLLKSNTYCHSLIQLAFYF